MATLTHAESRRMYSWWWDSHISPKNSKWLQENLTDMDLKVKSMIKVIEEDADSFARRAEMYYKKRPELMKLVEEFYRAYRALAERYDHATGALRQAQKTMSEVFPNQLPFGPVDEAPSGSSFNDGDPHTPEGFFGDDPSGDGSSPRSIRRNGAFSYDSDSTGKKGLKQLNEIFGKLTESRVRKELDFEEHSNESKHKLSNGSKAQQKGSEDEEFIEKVKKLQEVVSQLSAENQNLKLQLEAEAKSETENKSEVQLLHEACSKLESEKEEALLKFQESLRRMAELETEIEMFKNQSAEMLEKISRLDGAEEKRVILEKENEALLSDTTALKQKNDEQNDELLLKQEELEKLKLAVQDEHLRCVHAVAALESLENLQAQSVEALRVSMLQIQSGVQLLKETELKKQALEEELERVKEKVKNLNNQNASSHQTIRSLEDEISRLKEAQAELKDEIKNYMEVKSALEEERSSIKEELNVLKQTHKGIIDQIEAVGLNEESFQALVKELQEDNLQLKESCKKTDKEKSLLLEKLEEMQKISEKNLVLENSLSDANYELERLKTKIKALEESREMLEEKNLALESERDELVSKLERLTEDIEKLSGKNILLENSVSDTLVEVEGLRGKLKSLEETCRSLEDDKSNLQAEKDLLLSQVDLMGRDMTDLGGKFTELQGKHSCLEKQKELKDVQLAELEDLFKLKKEHYEELIASSNAKVANLEARIHALREHGQWKEEEFKDEQLKHFAAQTQIFILERCILDFKDRNVNLLKELQKMEQCILENRKRERALLDQVGRLRKGVQSVWSSLNNNEIAKLSDGSEELALPFILDKIKTMQNSVRDVEDERQGLLYEKSVYVTLLQQLGYQMLDLRTEKNSLKTDRKSKIEELLLLQGEKVDLLESTVQLKNELETGQKREATLDAEIKSLSRQFLDLKAAQLTLKDENAKLRKEKVVVSSQLLDAREEVRVLEEEYTAIFRKATLLASLLVIYEKFGSDRVKDIKSLNSDLICSQEMNDNLEKKVVELTEKTHVAEAENSHLKDVELKMDECKHHLTVLAVELNIAKTVTAELISRIETVNRLLDNRSHLLIMKEMELSEATLKLKVVQAENVVLHADLEDIRLELNEVKIARDGLQEEIIAFVESLSVKEKEIALALEAKETLGKELRRLDEENADLRVKGEESRSTLLNEIDRSEGEVALLRDELQVANVQAAVFEEKVLELMGTSERLKTVNLVERESFNKELVSRHTHIEELKGKIQGMELTNKEMKAELDEYMSLMSPLGKGISSLESLILLSRKRNTPNHHEPENDVDIANRGGNVEQDNDMKREVSQGILELQKLLAKVEALQEVLVESGSRPAVDYGDSSVQSVMTSLDGASAQYGKNPHVPTNESKRSSGAELKDIQLDHVTSASKYDFDEIVYDNGDVDNNSRMQDQMLELWETAERQSSPITSESCTRHPSSEMVEEKELSVDKLEVPMKELDFSWNKDVVERLSTDADRLSIIKASVEELKNKMEKSEGSKAPKSFEYDTVKTQLQEAEGTILQLIETNKKLRKKADDYSTSPGTGTPDLQEKRILRKKQVSERARRGSDKICRLELELQKLQYILLKLEEEYQNTKTRAAERSTRILLSDYLYGRKTGRRKRRHLCGCVRPKSTDDYD